MSAPAGPCEWCGGPQWWTIASGVMYVKCQAGCQSLFPSERVVLLPDSEGADGFESLEPDSPGQIVGIYEEGEGKTL